MKRREFIKQAAEWTGFGAVLPAAAELAKKPIVALVLTNVPQTQIAGLILLFRRPVLSFTSCAISDG